jgi:hypothetical protein
MAEKRENAEEEELLEEQQILDLPAREALSIVDPGVFGIAPPLGRGPAPPAQPTPTEAGPESANAA